MTMLAEGRELGRPRRCPEEALTTGSKTPPGWHPFSWRVQEQQGEGEGWKGVEWNGVECRCAWGMDVRWVGWCPSGSPRRDQGDPQGPPSVPLVLFRPVTFATHAPGAIKPAAGIIPAPSPCRVPFERNEPGTGSAGGGRSRCDGPAAFPASCP